MEIRICAFLLPKIRKIESVGLTNSTPSKITQINDVALALDALLEQVMRQHCIARPFMVLLAMR